MGIRFVGETVAKKLAKHFGSLDILQNAGKESLLDVDEIGERIAESLLDYFSLPSNLQILERLKSFGLQLEMSETELEGSSNKLEGKSFVISGTFKRYSRDQLKSMIELNGGKNLSSVSSNTDFIIAGEKMGPGKLKKANELNIPVISEEKFAEMIK